MTSWLKRAEQLLESVDEMASQKLKDDKKVNGREGTDDDVEALRGAKLDAVMIEAAGLQQQQQQQHRKEMDALGKELDDCRARAADGERQAAKERGELVSRITSLQAAVAERDFEVAKLSRQVETLNGRLDRSKSVIESLRMAPSSLDTSMDELQQQQKQPDHEVTLLRLQVAENQAIVADLRAELNDAQVLTGQVRASLVEKQDRLQSDLQNESSRRKTAESDSRSLRSELRTEREKMASAQAQVEDLKREITSLKVNSLFFFSFSLFSFLFLHIFSLPLKHSMRHGASALNSIENEDRIRKLTDALLSKQSVIENLAAERSALILQLEKATPATTAPSSENHHRIWQYEGEEVSSHKPILAPLSGVVPRRFFGWASQLDAAWTFLHVQLLFKRPRMRLFVIFYIVFVHVAALFFLRMCRS